MPILKVIGVVILFSASVVGGAVLGAIAGAIFAPVKIMQIITGKGDSSSDEVTFIDDEI